jgi:hypothetical protein
MRTKGGFIDRKPTALRQVWLSQNPAAQRRKRSEPGASARGNVTNQDPSRASGGRTSTGDISHIFDNVKGEQ